MIAIVRSSTPSEPELLVLLGSGLVVLATLVRRFCPLEGGGDVPKARHLFVWIAPKEIAEYFEL
ncbi:MAG TPA: hypothetical protein VGV15_03240 [Terriglobales bacterium]|nr:hypothetical protein [Terriglobales bacterium]